MRIYKNWKWTQGEQIDSRRFIYDITNSDGIDWYELMVELDKIEGRWVVGYSEDEGYVSWATDGPVSGMYVPKEGISVAIVESVPFVSDKAHEYDFDGKTFTLRELPKKPERTKEDILADLIKLQEELKAL